MTNFEYIQTLDAKELSHFLCEICGALLPEEDKRLECEVCPVEPLCPSLTLGNGWMRWLMEEKK